MVFPLQFLHQAGSVHSLDSSTSSTFEIFGGDELSKQTVHKAMMQRHNGKHKKPSGKPKRPLSAYNIFFKTEREKLVKANIKVGFANMAREISVKWKALSAEDRKEYVLAADIDQKRYRSAVLEWKEQNKLEMAALHSSQQVEHSPLASLLAHNDPAILQHLIMQRQIMEHQQQQQLEMMQTHMQNAVRLTEPRRMSMPTIINGDKHNRSFKTMKQLLANQQAAMGRRFSMPMPLQSVEQLQQVTSTTPYFGPTDFVAAEGVYDSEDESSLGDETTDALINMPIMNIEGKMQQEAEDPQVPPVISSMSPRRFSMPTITNNIKGEWDLNPIGASASRRLSLPQLADELKEMQDILDMLNEDEVGSTFNRQSSNPAA
jgi:hypothetical protein